METALDPHDLKTRPADRSFTITCRATAAERGGPKELVDGSLEDTEQRVLGADVLPETELAATHEHAAEFAQRRSRISNAAKDSHDDGGIEGSVPRRQCFGGAVDNLDRYDRIARTFSGGRARSRIRLDRKDGGDPRRRVLERAPVAAADLDHAARQPCEQPTAEITGNRVGSAKLAPLEIARET